MVVELVGSLGPAGAGARLDMALSNWVTKVREGGSSGDGMALVEAMISAFCREYYFVLGCLACLAGDRQCLLGDEVLKSRR